MYVYSLIVFYEYSIISLWLVVVVGRSLMVTLFLTYFIVYFLLNKIEIDWRIWMIKEYQKFNSG